MAGFTSGSYYQPQSNYDFSALLGGNNNPAAGMGDALGGGLTLPPVATPDLSASISGLGSQLGTGNQGFGFNMPTAQLGLSALGSLGNIWGAYQANNLARQQFDYTKGVTNTNLNNSIKSYNTSLEDRARARASVTGQSSADTQAYIDKNSLSR